MDLVALSLLELLSERVEEGAPLRSCAQRRDEVDVHSRLFCREHHQPRLVAHAHLFARRGIAVRRHREEAKRKHPMKRTLSLSCETTPDPERPTTARKDTRHTSLMSAGGSILAKSSPSGLALSHTLRIFRSAASRYDLLQPLLGQSLASPAEKMKRHGTDSPWLQCLVLHYLPSSTTTIRTARGWRW